MQIGDYLLKDILFDGPTTRTWLADQVSVSRPVIIDSLNLEQQQNPDTVEQFLADVRAKARVDHPFIGSVYEAIREGRLCFYARENLSGNSLQHLQETGQKLNPAEVAHIIKQISEANLYLEKHGIASLPIPAEHIFITENNLCRISNMAIAEQRDHNVSTQDKHNIASILIDLLKTGVPGATRTRSLLDYMADLSRDIPLTWEQIRDLSDSVERQLTQPSEPMALENATRKFQKKGISKKVIMLSGIGIGATIVLTLGAIFLNQPTPPKPRELMGTVQIPAGQYPTHDGGHIKLPNLWIDSHEVTIAEYAEFLTFLDQLTPEQHRVYQHENQPDTKTSHLPDDWENLYAAARRGDTWNGRKVDLNCPVVGIDWWDAYTYCSRYGSRLPSQEEWHAALSLHKGNISQLTPAPWGAVDQPDVDVTSNGIHGLAGNVSEWSLRLSKDPAMPTSSKMPVLCGGSFLDAGSGATTRKWLPPTNGIDPRSTRRNDLGFRTITDQDPAQ